MHWRRYRDYAPRPPRPKVEKLAKESAGALLAKLDREVQKSPILVGLNVAVRGARGRFYVERLTDDGLIPLGRVTPLADSAVLLLEYEWGENKWKEVARGGALKVIKAIAGDIAGTFHGLGKLDATLREAGSGLTRQAVEPDGDGFRFVDSGRRCTTHEALFHGFGIPLKVLIEPRIWYCRHRRPWLREYSADRTLALVDFCIDTLSGVISGGCLYACRDAARDDHNESEWGAHTIRPSESGSLSTAHAWIVKRKWKPWC